MSASFESASLRSSCPATHEAFKAFKGFGSSLMRGPLLFLLVPPAVNRESSGGTRMNDWLFYSTFLQTVP